MLFGRDLDGARIIQDDHGESRGHGEGENGVWYAVEQHNGTDPNEGQNANQQVDQAIGNKFLNVGNVARDALDEVALLLFTMPV